MKTLMKQTLIIALLAVIGGGAAWVARSKGFELPLAGPMFAKAGVPVVVNESPLVRDSKFTTSFSPIVKKVAPAVVNIYTTKTVRSPYGPDMFPFFNDPMFRRFFGDPDDDGAPRQRQRKRKETSLGSGVIVSKDGYVLTNNHVVDGADEVKVALAKGKKEFSAKVVGRDPKTDIAVLKIEGEDFSYATLADSDKLEVGDVVLAIGNPFGIGQTVTMGIVSAVGRGDIGIEQYEDFIQTDAAINPGNSGGALVDAEGRLVGINTAILSRSGGNQGIGFAVPVNLVRNVMERIRQDGKVVRGFLGVLPQDLTPELAREFEVTDAQGALIGHVTPKSAAAEAGLKEGDVVIEINGKPVKDARSLRLMVAQAAPGAKVDVKVLRRGKEKSFTATLKEMPDQRQTAEDEESSPGSGDALDGVEIGDIISTQRRQLDLPSELKGALVTKIDRDSTAFEAGLRQGDVILEINRKPVSNADEAVEATKGLKGKRILLRVWSRGASHYIVVDESKGK